MRSAACSTVSTRNPFSPSVICRRMAPTFPPITAAPFHIASVTVRPNPSRIDFCKTTAARRCRAFTRIGSSTQRSDVEGRRGDRRECRRAFGDRLLDGENGFLVDTRRQAAERIVQLVQTPGLRARLGEQARETVRQNFLMSRLLEDWIEVIGAELTNRTSGR